MEDKTEKNPAKMKKNKGNSDLMKGYLVWVGGNQIRERNTVGRVITLKLVRDQRTHLPREQFRMDLKIYC